MLRAAAPVATASVSAFVLTLAMYPTVVLGGALFAAGLTMKLLAAAHGIVLALGLAVVCGVVVVALNDRLARLVPKDIERRVVFPVLRRLVRIPLWVVTLTAFGVPALAQLYANFSMIRMLVFVGATRSMRTVLLFSVVNVCVTVAVNVLGVLSPAWLKPAKVVFAMQTFWVVQMLVVNRGMPAPSGSTSGAQYLWPFLSTTIMGWGSVILSSMPDDAVVSASRAAMQAALFTGGTAATAVTAMSMSQQPQPHQQDPTPPHHDDANVHAITTAIGNVRAEDMSNALRWLVETSDSAFKSARSGLDKLEEIHNDTAAAVTTEPRATKTPLALSLLLNLNPPLWAAIPVTVIRAVPTVLVFLIAELVALVQVLTGQGLENALGLPLILLPFCLSEILSVLRAIGIRRGFRAVLNASHTFETDGMQLLLWQSPKLLAAWIQFKQADEMLNGLGGNLLSLLFAPKRFLFPNEELIALAPELDGVILAKLVGSGVIDVIGVATFAVPVLGEVLDVLWAPVSGVLINRLYGYPGFAFMGFAEEILPFTDVIPTASFTWAWIYLIYVPVWVVRARRRVAAGQPPFQLRVKAE